MNHIYKVKAFNVQEMLKATPDDSSAEMTRR